MKGDAELIQTLQRKLQSLERIVALKDVSIAEMNIRVEGLEMTSYDGTLIWKIKEFTRKRQESMNGKAPSVYSPFFYTARAGRSC